MFERNTRVYIPLAGGTVPGVVVGSAEPGTYRNRRGVEVPTQRVPVISRRVWEGRTWYQLSQESIGLLSLRESIEAELDVTKDGQPIPLTTLWAKQRESLQAYLASRQQPAATTARERKAATTA